MLSKHGCQIAPRTFYAWLSRPPSARTLWDTVVTEVLADGRLKVIGGDYKGTVAERTVALKGVYGWVDA